MGADVHGWRGAHLRCAPLTAETFVSSLIEHTLIDELKIFVNPVAIGNGLRVFNAKKPLKLTVRQRIPVES